MMTLFFTYELKVAILIAVFYIFWRLLVANETWHRLNRIVLLSTAIASFVLPLCVITIHHTVEVTPDAVEPASTVVADLESATSETDISSSLQQAPVAETALVPTETQQSFNWQLPLTVIYIIGVLVVLLRVAMSLWRLHTMAAESEIHLLDDGRQIAVCEKIQSPFSWWKTVFLNRQDYEDGPTALLTHELGHIRLHHSADVLLVELLTALQWFNPTMWMLRADLRTIHEYEADQQVISHGFNDVQYLQLLIRKAAVQSGYSLANGFFNSTLKKRIKMMMKPKSTRHQWLRFAYLLPIIAVSLALSAKVQLDVVDRGSNIVFSEPQEPITNENRLFLIVDVDEARKIVPQKGKTRSVWGYVDDNGHWEKKSAEAANHGKHLVVHMPKGSVLVNDKETKKIEADVNYSFAQATTEWQLNGVPFDENNVPVLNCKDLKRIEQHWNGKKNVVNFITSAESAIILIEKDGRECIGVKAPVGAFYTWLVNGHLAERGAINKDKWWNVRGYYPLYDHLITLDGKEINKGYLPYVPLNYIKEVKLIQGETPRRIELYTHYVTEFNRDVDFDYPAEYKEKQKAWIFFKAEEMATGRQLKDAEITVVETGQKAKTNAEGWCELKVPLGTTVRASYPGLEAETYKVNHFNGNDIQGWTFCMSKPGERIYGNVQQEAEFAGDKDKWFAINTQLPKATDGKGISRRVTVNFVVNEDGSISGVRIRNGINKTLNEEALRLVRSMPRWKPAIKDGKPVKSLVLSSVSFENIQDNVLIGAYVRDEKTKKYLNDATVELMNMNKVVLSKPRIQEVVRGSEMYRYVWDVPRQDKYIIKVTKPKFQTEYRTITIKTSETQKIVDDIILKSKS